jgi:hypothetical protein
MEVTHLSYTGLTVGLEHLKIETRLTIEKFTSVMGGLIRKTDVLTRIFPHFDFNFEENAARRKWEYDERVYFILFIINR